MSKDSTLPELDAEIELLETRLQSTAEDHPDHIHALDRQSVLYQYKYQKTREPSYIDEAVRLGLTACYSIPFGKHDSYNMGAITHHLSSCLGHSFVENRQLEAIDNAIELGEESLKYFPAHTKEWERVVSNLIWVLGRKAAASSSKKDTITEIIKKQKEVLSLTNPDDKVFRSNSLLDLGGSLFYRYRHSMDVSDLDDAIQYGYQALEVISEETNRNHVYNNLSVHLFTHFKATGIFRSLEEALRISALILALPPQDLRSRVNHLCNHGVYLYQKSQRFKDTDPSLSLVLLEQAFKCGRDSLQLFEEVCLLEHRDLEIQGHIINMLGAWMGTKLKTTKNLADGKDGIDFLQASLQLLPPYHEERPAALRNLAHLHETQFQILKARGDQNQALAELEKAIQYGKEIVDSIPEDHPELGEHYKNFAIMLVIKNEELDDPNTYELAKKYLILAAATESAPPLVRISTGIQAGLYRWEDEVFTEANQYLQAAVELLPRLNPHEMSTDDLQLALRDVSGLASTATAMAIAAGRPDAEALQSLETAHGVISGLFMNSKSDISKLYEKNEKLAEKYENIRAQLSKIARQQSTLEAYSNTRQQQRLLNKDLVATETEIRRLAGFEHFQESLEEEAFKALACDGPIIAINIARNRSDALIVTTQKICTISLPECPYSKLEEKLVLFGNLGNENRRNAVPRRSIPTRETPVEALIWLWEAVVKPILDVTELTASRRVWWITTGLAGRAPLHAAGHHSPGSTENTQNRVISSYISSFKALKYAREKAAFKVPRHKMLLVTMKSNPRPYKDLDTSHEEKVVHEVFGQSLTHLSQPDPESVSKEVPNHSFVHFACHGFSSVNNPSQNGLLLVKNGQAATLKISDLEVINLKSGAVAYLSACSTAEQSDMKLLDEAIHLANSFQMLGFQHVIGTLWGADDTAAGEVARRFYRKLRVGKAAGDEVVELDVAVALHESMLEYKGTLNGEGDVLKWAPFIHTGV